MPNEENLLDFTQIFFRPLMNSVLRILNRNASFIQKSRPFWSIILVCFKSRINLVSTPTILLIISCLQFCVPSACIFHCIFWYNFPLRIQDISSEGIESKFVADFSEFNPALSLQSKYVDFLLRINNKTCI